MSREIDEIKDAAGDYRKWALEARKQYINLRLRQDPEIRALYIRSADRVARELRQLAVKTPSGRLRKRQLEQLEADLRAEADRLTGSFTKAFEQYIELAVEAGGGYSQAIALDLFKKAGMDITGLRTMFATVNRQAVEACWARTKKGLFLSDRIWQQGEKFRNTMRDIIQEAVATGQDAVKTARMLQQYVRQGAMTLARDYPNMMKRMKGRVPGNISYEALRLARTEMTAAFGEGTIAAARVSPSYIGMKWVLSHNHPVVDICDTLAEHDEGLGLGPGVYPPGNEPPYPAHPNCLCALVPIHEDPEEFVARLKDWLEDPKNDPELEQWYQNIYKPGAGKAKLPKASQKAEEEEDVINLDDFEDLYEKYQPKDSGLNNTIEDVKNHSHLLKYEATEDELQVVKYYTGDKGCREFNQALRFPEIGKTASKKIKKGIETLTNLIKKANPLSQNTIFYRHSRLDVLEYIYNPEVREIAREVVKNGDTDKMSLLKKLLIDSTIQDKGFLSTSYHPGVFVELDGLEIRIHAPKGFRGGLFVEEVSRFRSEREYLFAPGQKFRVLDVEVDKVYPGVKTNLILHAVPVE